MKSLILISFSLLVFNNSIFSQEKKDSTAKPEETTFYDGPPNTVFAPGFLLRTRSKNYYELTGKAKQTGNVPNPVVLVYKDKRKYKLIIQGVTDPVPATKLRDVIESNIEGAFR